MATGLLVMLAGLAWFYIATFVIIPAFASEAYGIDESPYVARFGALGNSFGQVVTAMLTRPALTLQVVMEPLRLQYLVKLLAPIRAKVNLIPFNEHEGASFKRPSNNRIHAFLKILLDRNMTAIIRKSKGDDISAACGQLKAAALKDA